MAAPQRAMRAALLARLGGPEAVQLASDVAVPAVRAQEVLVRVAAASVNPIDCRIREGYARSVFERHLPLVLGRDFSGTVVERGSAAREFKLGKAVFGAVAPLSVQGSHAEYVAVHQNDICAKPANLSHTEAAAIPFASLTAWTALKRVAELQPGQRLLVLGGGSAVGGAAVQLARAWGVEVCATAGARSADRVLSMGAQVADSSEPFV